MQQPPDVVPVMKPQLPAADKLLPYIERIDAARYYSNHGPLHREFEARLARHFGVRQTELAVVANGTVALSAALLAIGARAGSICLLPSWTFVASAAAVWAANLRPHFVDVDERTWTLDPQALKRRKDLADVGAVMNVAAFGAPIDTAAWDEFEEETGIPVLHDCAASFDSIAAIPGSRPGKAPIMISLHATKVFGVGEGGLVITTDEAVLNRFHRICNFGAWDSPEGQILGYNGKLNEYNAAVGLATLDAWPQRRARIAELTGQYVERLVPEARVSTVPGYGAGWISCYCNVRCDRDSTPVIARLTELGIETRRWWQRGVHAQSAYRNFTRDNLPVTDMLGRRVFGLPFYHDITVAQLDRVASSLADALGAVH